MAPTSFPSVLEYPSQPSLKNLTSDKWDQPLSTANPALESLGSPHVESFNFMLEEGLRMAVDDVLPVEFAIPAANEDESEGNRIKIWITDCTISPPRVPIGTSGVKDPKVYPSEARQKGGSYKGECVIK